MVEETAREERFLDAFMTCWDVLETKEQEPSHLKIDAYARALERYSIEEIESAFSHAITQCVFFPKPVELINFITGGPQQIEDSAQIEGIKVVNAIKSAGAYNSVIFKDPVTMAVIHTGFGGWVHLCGELKEPDEKWFLKDFIKLYATYTRRSMTRSGHLAGLIEENALASGTEIPKAIEIDATERPQIENKSDNLPSVICKSCKQVVDVGPGDKCPECGRYA